MCCSRQGRLLQQLLNAHSRAMLQPQPLVRNSPNSLLSRALLRQQQRRLRVKMQHSKQHLGLQALAHSSSSNNSSRCSSKGQQQQQQQHNLLLPLSQQPGHKALLSLQGAWRRY